MQIQIKVFTYVVSNKLSLPFEKVPDAYLCLEKINFNLFKHLFIQKTNFYSSTPTFTPC